MASTTNWADSDSEEEAIEQTTTPTTIKDDDDQSDSDSDDSDASSGEEEEEEVAEEAPTPLVTEERKEVVVDMKNLSKKERKALKEKELEDLDQLILSEMGGLPTPPSAETSTPEPPIVPTESEGGTSTKDKKKKNK
eukprot:CAMPEP_0114365022 /NCGR_PEP_ID=MMETSP0101-20121206/28029_1 /TAXON_ID=38822 ORGANISM="Pteridomonas danica, Strain PT" /NCGR_SAMPLE_ID=MMETSP0101 /ASSEMBLY_ACC=CAM_ASM_000211 /LENGTH=136 /DNA_ID=CAMNT_0001513005 /DNA_START=91 /DNA_END=498 /DNA_ORIENTATION=-